MVTHRSSYEGKVLVMSRRERVAQAIRREMSVIVHERLRDPRLGAVTITHVELTQDMRLAWVYYSVFGKEEEMKATREVLQSALGFIRKLVAQRIQLRFAPEIVFKEDSSLERSLKIQEIIDELKEKHESREDD